MKSQAGFFSQTYEPNPYLISKYLIGFACCKKLKPRSLVLLIIKLSE